MRITNATLMRGYNRDFNRLLSQKNKIERQITSTRNFVRASEAPLSAAKALNVRKSYYYSEQHKENLKVASKFYTEAETSLLQVSDKMAQIRETIIAACNTTKDRQEWAIYAQQLETSARELCAIFNTDSAGRAIFGGESDNGLPFTIIEDSNGNAATVLYHGVPVNALSDYFSFPYSDDVYIDIGLGMYTDQRSHYTDPQSVLRTSFNGAKVSGCGAEYGVADVDLSAIKESRKYCIDVYAGNVKKTITFTGKGSYEENVEEINKQLTEAFKKEKAYGKDYPEMDAQGVISLRNSEGKAVENGIVCVVNNTIKEPRAEKLVVDNDSGYTDKYRLKLSELEEGRVYKVNVTVGGVTKTIEFEAGTDNLSDSDNPVYREDVTVKNFQDALEAAFGKGVVNISPNDPTKGIVSSEGQTVKLTKGIVEDGETEEEQEVNIVSVSSSSKDKINLKSIKTDGKSEYSFKIGSNVITFKAGDNETETRNNINQAIRDKGLTGYEIDPKGIIKNAAGEPVAIEPSGTESSVTVGTWTDYTIALSSDDLIEGNKYSLKVIKGNTVKNIDFTAGADEAENLQAIQDALDKAFGAGTVNIDADGNITAADGKSVSVSNNETNKADDLLFEREAIYSNNYIQLTLDAARALRNGDLEYANGCIDRIVSANENLLVEIADLGCNEEFIDFNLTRITTREENLAERQNELEFIDPEKAITLWKTYEALYNACLQMSSTVVPNSIFNYMK